LNGDDQRRRRRPARKSTMASLAAIMDGQMNPVLAYMQGKIRVTGAMQDLMRLQRVML
jgi:putative sterol carrier protein